MGLGTAGGVAVIASPTERPPSGGAPSALALRPPPATAAGAIPPRAALLLVAVLMALPLLLGGARLVTGPWFHQYNPREMSLVDGYPVSWEATYYTDHLPTLASASRPGFGISPVHYRTLIPLFVAAQLYAWTGQAYWAFAATDFLFWGLAGVATVYLALRLGARPWAAALGGLLLSASPVLISHMWRHDLHTADFAGLPIALWAATVLVDEPRPRWQLVGGLSLVLLLLSLSYQYQWLVAPLAFVLCATQPRIGWRRGALISAAAVAGYLALTAASEALFRHTVGDPTSWTGATVAPSSALLGRLTAARSAGEVAAAARSVLPGWQQVVAVWQAYHPVVLLAGLAGICALGRRAVALTLTGTAVALVSHLVYPAPWTAALCYPLIAIGAGVACAAAGRIVATRIGQADVRLVYGFGLAFALLCAAVTNLDLAGVPGFALDWWRSYTNMQSRF
jgi:hypothetical protein